MDGGEHTNTTITTKEAAYAIVQSKVYGRRVALLACGSFNPPTYMHLRMFERARDYLEKTHSCVVVEGILSPVADTFGKADLLSAEHRLKMVELAVRNSAWLRADGWECSRGEWTRTLNVLKHFNKELQYKYGGGNCDVVSSSSSSNAVHLMFLCGGDVLESFAKTNPSGSPIWRPEHIEEIVRDYGLVVIWRSNSDPMRTVYMLDVLRKLQKNIFIIEDETCPNDISSTRLRMAIRRGESIRYCTDDEVINYIETNKLYSMTTQGDSSSSTQATRSAAVAVSEVDMDDECRKSASASSSSTSSPPTSASAETIVRCPTTTTTTKLLGVVPNPPEPPKRLSSIARQYNLQRQHSISTNAHHHHHHHFNTSDEDSKDWSLSVAAPPSIRSSSASASASASSSSSCAQREPIWCPSFEEEEEEEQPGICTRSDKTMGNDGGDDGMVEVENHGPSSSTSTSSAQQQKSPAPILQAEECLPSTSTHHASSSSMTMMMQAAPHHHHQHHVHGTSWMRSLESPNYDNVTLDELLAASTSWAEYVCSTQKGHAKNNTTEGGSSSSASYSCSLMRAKSLSHESCTDIGQQQHQPELTAEQPTTSEAIQTMSHLGNVRCRGPTHWREAIEGRSYSAPQRRSIRFAASGTTAEDDMSGQGGIVDDDGLMTRISSSGNAPSTHTSTLLTPSSVQEGHQHRLDGSGPNNAGGGASSTSSTTSPGNITLTYRRYKLSAAPETTV